ncbi:hypothetical protein OS493_034195 [Desmophyllum pertusum]|uniref:Uncharacterized protein n=1 Tax=Desmophyllum pertusum TaxID=174260 RepID=A0A9X0D2L7_9CNID|nr:hypothetical protein OS493_034195 [Desmophyllum pertusum]
MLNGMFDFQTKLREKAELDREFDYREICTLKKQVSQESRENAKLRSHSRTVEKENQLLRELLAERSINPKTSAVFGDVSSSSTGSNNVQAGEPCRSSSSRTDSDGSSEEEPFVDALTEPAALTLDNN